MSESFDKPLVSYAIICHNRKDELREALYSIFAQDYKPIEIIVIDNNSSDGTEALFKTEFAQPNIYFERLHENLGVSGGRNVAMGKAQGEIMIIIDDDATVVDPHATAIVIEKFKNDLSIGALAFKIVDHGTRDIQINKKGFRLRRDNKVDLDTEFENWGFRGAGHAIRKHVYKEVGPYPDYFPYGHEELDICLKILNAGYRIIYFPKVEVTHKRITIGRLPRPEIMAVSLENRIKVALRNLPWCYVFTTAVVWTGMILIRTRFNLRSIFLAYRNLWRKRYIIMQERRPLSPSLLKKASRLGAPLYY